MNERLHKIESIDAFYTHESHQLQALASLESGKVIYFPQYCYTLTASEKALLSETILDPGHKNISYDYRRQHLAGLHTSHGIDSAVVQTFMHRFSEFAKQLVDSLFPSYNSYLIWGRTSYRPAEIKGRKTSKRKDDTRVHVDSFSATPVNGLRILRVFCNINPAGKPRVWHLGDPFSQVLATFSERIPSYSAFLAKLLKGVRATKSLRSPYDHYMLKLHDLMKLDEHYQQTLSKYRFDFPSQSTWVVFTDQVSHAALSGQFLLEQTFYLPVQAQQTPELSPLKQWEKKLNTQLCLV